MLMTEQYRPDQDGATPPLNLAENAQKVPLYEQLAQVLHAARKQRLGEVDTEEFEAIKIIAEADTEELQTVNLPPVTTRQESKEKREQKIAQRREEKAREQRLHENIRDFSERLGGLTTPGKPSTRRLKDK